MTTRGIRNHNPGNIDRNKTKWQGMAADQSSDPRFIVFTAPEWGIRALARTLLTYQNAHGLNTIKKIINRWAPPVENDTDAYVRRVAQACGVEPSQPIDIDMCEMMFPLVKAIIAHENAGFAYPDAVVLEGLRRAGVPDVKPKPLAKQNTFLAQAGAGVAATGAVAVQGLSAAADHAPTIKGWADQLADYTGAPFIANAAMVLTTVAGGLVLLGIVLKVMKQRAQS